MKQRALEILFRHKFLLVLPLLVIVPLTTMLAVRSRTVQWQSVANVWVNQPTTVQTQDRLGDAPAPNQAALLQNFIYTTSFAKTVLQQTPLASELDGGAREQAAILTFEKSVTVTPNGNAFVTVAAKSDTPDLAYAIAQATIATFSKEVAQEASSEGQTSVTLQEDAFNKANAQFTTSLNALATYLSQHPDLATAGQGNGPSAADTDPAYAQLLAQANSDQQAYTDAKQRYDAAKQQARAGSTALPYTFSVVDPPQKPTLPITEKKTALLKLPGIGFAVALLLSVLVGVALVLADRRVFSPADVRESLGLTVLGTLPDLASRWNWRRQPREVVRWRIAGPARAGADPHAPAAPVPPVGSRREAKRAAAEARRHQRAG